MSALVVRAADPLGLGGHPPPPPDPEKIGASECRAFLSKGELAELDAYIAQHGYLPIAEVRRLVHLNAGGAMDPETIIEIDLRVNYKIYVNDGELCTREELYTNHAFHELGVQPEDVFNRQEIGMFVESSGEKKYVARDMDDDSFPFLPISDVLKGVNARLPAQKALTKIFVGKAGWTDFSNVQGVLRGLVKISTIRKLSGLPPLLAMNILPMLMPPAAADPAAASSAAASSAAASSAAASSAAASSAAAMKHPLAE